MGAGYVRAGREKESIVSITFPNESPEYRAARDALLQREVALRRQMEAVAAELRALPPGGEVPEDYRFDRIGEDGSPATVRMSGLFGGGDTLMLYHYMFPRHSEDERPGPTSGALADVPLEEGPCPSCTALIDMWEGTMPHFEAWEATWPSSPGPPSSGWRPSRATRGGGTSACCRPRTTASAATTAATTRRASPYPS
jgi:predicted dithiol-disulfide oxidoreductase (DUF899 family)